MIPRWLGFPIVCALYVVAVGFAVAAGVVASWTKEAA